MIVDDYEENVRKANEALSPAECRAAVEVGFHVTSCTICKKPTLWRSDNPAATQPKTCGRMMCGEAAREPWAARRQG